MRVGLLGRKVGMTQIYEENGAVVPVTVLECGPCTVLQVRTEERDGYHAWQLGFDDKRRKSATHAERGHAKKVSTEPKRFVREVRQDGPTEINEGQTLTVDLFSPVKRVDVTGTSKGRGYAGVIKRHGFRGLRASHGVKRMHRHPGSSGPSATRRAPKKASASQATSGTPGSRCVTSRSCGSTPRTTCSCSGGPCPARTAAT